ncbi:NUDIX domain-containing protein [Streptomyces afghaniensis]|uniref:NUDIX domain-containing protein n=1 Tax=Streptomyces afghaniensis TaxID=66865 RepID=UPI0033A04E60
MTRDVFDHRVIEAAAADVRLAKIQLDGAGQWLISDGKGPSEPLAAEVWVFDEALARVLLVHHRWRGWVPPGGRVEPGETPREGARRELLTIADAAKPLVAESGQPAAWTSLDEDWASCFPEDSSRVRQHARWLHEVSAR